MTHIQNLLFGLLMATPVLGQNMLANPGFENGTTGWEAFGNVFPQTANAPQFVPHGGTELVSTFGNFSGGFNVSGLFQSFPANPGDTFTIDAWSRHWSGDPMVGLGAPNNNWVVMKIAFFDAGATEIAGFEGTILDGTSPQDVWIDNAPVSGTAPANTTSVQALILYLQPGLDSGAAHIDDVVFTGPPASGSPWIVDQANGPGTNFTSLLSAATSTQVLAGDTLRIRTGSYAAPTLNRGLTLVPETWSDSVGFHGQFTITGVPQGQRCDLKNLHAESGSGSELLCQSNGGSVHLEAVDLGVFEAQGLRVSGCAQVTLTDCDMSYADVSNQSLVSMTDSRILAGLGPQPWGLRVDNSEVILADSSVFGSPGLVDPFTCAIIAQPGAGTELANGSLAITGRFGSSSGGIAQSYFCGVLGSAPGIQGSGTVTIDPSTPSPHNGTVGVSVQSRVLPVLSVRYPAPGGVLHGSVWAPGSPGAPVAVFVGLPWPASPLSVPGFGRLWLNPSLIITALVAPLDAAGTLQFSAPFPTSSSGALAFQAAVVNLTTGGVRLSTGSLVVINQQ